jgi:hypothetical protein
MVDRPAYTLGWLDGNKVGRREGYNDAVSELGVLDADQITSVYRQYARKNFH